MAQTPSRRRRFIWACMVLIVLIGAADVYFGLPVYRKWRAQSVATLPQAATSAPSSARPTPRHSAKPSHSAHPSPTKPGKDAPVTDAQWRQDSTCGNRTGKIVFTADDWGTDEHIRSMLKLAKRLNILVIFFVIGNRAIDPATGQERPIVGEIRAAGMLVGNHSATHPRDFRDLTPKQTQAEIAGGLPGTGLFRPPEGSYDEPARRQIMAAGFDVCLWGVDTNDYEDGVHTADIKTTVMREVRPDSVILGHMFDDSDYTKAWPWLVKHLKRDKHYQICAPYEGTAPYRIPTPITRC